MKQRKQWIAIGISLVLAVLMMLARGVLSAETTADRILAVCDGFSIVGVLEVCFGLLLWVAGEGFFDSITYAAKSAAHMLIPGRARQSHKTFYDYKQEKAEKRMNRSAAGVVLRSGIVLLVLGVVFTVIWYQVAE